MSAGDALSPYQFGVREEAQTHWGHPALHIDVKHEGKTVAGLGVHQRPHPDTGAIIGVPNVWVNEEHQRKGIATAMYGEVKKRWPTVPIEHSPHASAAAHALNRTLR